MTRDAFQAQLETLMGDLDGMGVLVHKAIDAAVSALVQQDAVAAEAVIAGDALINDAYASIEHRCLELLTLQQPMASDLRRIAATLKVITDLERMADHAVDIARVVVRIGERPLIKPLVDIPAMATLAQEMVGDALAAFIGRDQHRAMQMVAKDHEIDRLHRAVIHDVQVVMERDGTTVGQGIQLLFVSAALERIGDHATNLGEWLIYLLTGQRTDLNQ